MILTKTFKGYVNTSALPKFIQTHADGTRTQMAVLRLAGSTASLLKAPEDTEYDSYVVSEGSGFSWVQTTVSPFRGYIRSYGSALAQIGTSPYPLIHDGVGEIASVERPLPVDEISYVLIPASCPRVKLDISIVVDTEEQGDDVVLTWPDYYQHRNWVQGRTMRIVGHGDIPTAAGQFTGYVEISTIGANPGLGVIQVAEGVLQTVGGSFILKARGTTSPYVGHGAILSTDDSIDFWWQDGSHGTPANSRTFCFDMIQAQLVSGSGGGSGDLPIASADTLGGVKVGAALSISEAGVLNYELPSASSNQKGGIVPGRGLDVVGSAQCRVTLGLVHIRSRLSGGSSAVTLTIKLADVAQPIAALPVTLEDGNHGAISISPFVPVGAIILDEDGERATAMQPYFQGWQGSFQPVEDVWQVALELSYDGALTYDVSNIS